MPRRGRPSTDITSRPATPEYRNNHIETFGERKKPIGFSSHTRLVIKNDPITGKQFIERTTDV